jgi:hypothetical protein
MHLYQIRGFHNYYYVAGQHAVSVSNIPHHIQDIISGVVCALFFFAVSVPMDIYNGQWTGIDGIIEYVFQANLDINLGISGLIEGPSAAKDLFNLDQLIPASGAAAVSYYNITGMLGKTFQILSHKLARAL